MKILVLGAGRMGLGAAYDPAHNADVTGVTVADLDIERAEAVVDKIDSCNLNAATIDVNDHRRVIELMIGYNSAISGIKIVEKII